jgi:hypothetical protein
MAKKTMKALTKKAPRKTSMPAEGRDPKGGLTAAGRAFYNKTEGANLRPGVKGVADTPDKMRRKGSFLTRHFTHPRGPMVDDKGQPTRLALSAHAWGEMVPKTAASAQKLAAKGRALLEKYHVAKVKSTVGKGKSAAKKTALKSAAKKSAAKK